MFGLGGSRKHRGKRSRHSHGKKGKHKHSHKHSGDARKKHRHKHTSKQKKSLKKSRRKSRKSKSGHKHLLSSCKKNTTYKDCRKHVGCGWSRKDNVCRNLKRFTHKHGSYKKHRHTRPKSKPVPPPKLVPAIAAHSHDFRPTAVPLSRKKGQPWVWRPDRDNLATAASQAAAAARAMAARRTAMSSNTGAAPFTSNPVSTGQSRGTNPAPGITRTRNPAAGTTTATVALGGGRKYRKSRKLRY